MLITSIMISKGVTRKTIKGSQKFVRKYKNKKNLASRNYNLTSKTKTQYLIDYTLINLKNNLVITIKLK